MAPRILVQDDGSVTGVVHLVNETFVSFHIDADEHEEVLRRATELSFGIPLGDLRKETAGVVIPGASRVHTFSSPGSTPKETKETPKATPMELPIGASSSTNLPDGEVWVFPIDEEKEQARKAEISHALGRLFTSNLQMDLMLGSGLEMQGGSSVKSKHIRLKRTVSKD